MPSGSGLDWRGPGRTRASKDYRIFTYDMISEDMLSGCVFSSAMMAFLSIDFVREIDWMGK